MESHLIKFDSKEWITATKGSRYKKYTKGINIIRLLEFSEGFTEDGYCTKGHAGIVLEGRILIDFNGKAEIFSSGDVIYIPEGKESRHKALISNGQKALLLLFETGHPEIEIADYCI